MVCGQRACKNAEAEIVAGKPKIQQTKILVIGQRFGDLFSFGLVWQYSTNQKQYNLGRFKVIATYVLTAVI